MTQVKARGIATDIVTTHLYPTDDIVRNAGGGRDGFSKVIKQAAANVTSFGYPGMPLVMTEFNAGLGLPTEVNGDTPYTAAMVLHNHLALQGVANLETLSFWSYSDLFEEGGMDSQPWHVRRRVTPRHSLAAPSCCALAMLSPPRRRASTHLPREFPSRRPQNGYGIMNVNGVPKPIYRFFQMLRALPAASVPVTAQVADAQDAIVQRVGSVSAGTVDAVVAVDDSMHPLIHVTALLNNFDVYDAPGMANKTVTVVFASLPAGATVPASAILNRIDSTHANAVAAWNAAGNPMYCSPSEIAAEMAASQLVDEAIALTAAGSSLSVTITLEPFSVSRVRFSYSVEA